MNDRRKQVILMVALAVVWGGVIFRYFDLSGPDESEPTIDYSRNLAIETTPTEEYLFLLNYADPFLKEVDSRLALNKGVLETRAPNKTQEVLSLPTISYLGMVSSREANAALVRLNDQVRLAKVGDKLDSLRILGVRSDSISVQFSDSIWSVGIVN